MGVDVIDGFLDDFDSFRKHCDEVDYSGEVNPFDGVLYPGISFNIPEAVQLEVFEKLGVVNPKIFLRITLDGEAVPHSAHNDLLMGKKGCIVYLNRLEHCAGGTSFVRHKDAGMELGPQDQEEENIWSRDTNDYDAWEVIKMVEMQPNRALIFDTGMMHRAEKPVAFGSQESDGRLVMVCFYD